MGFLIQVKKIRFLTQVKKNEIPNPSEKMGFLIQEKNGIPNPSEKMGFLIQEKKWDS